MNQTFLAFDLGAESGRGVLAEFDGQKLTLSEAGRFPTTGDAKEPGPDGVWRWDYREIVSQIRGILKAAEADHKLSGVAVDTWGVDFGLIDAAGELIEDPACYRDASHGAAMDETLGRMSGEDLWAETGIQLMPFNTLFQVRAIQKRSPDVLAKAARLLFMPDLLASALVGNPAGASELTIASTSQMLDPRTQTWNTRLLDRLGLPYHFLQPIVKPGATYGTTPGGTVVRATGGHDTASAVAAVPAIDGKTWAYISSGTWSLLGIESETPVLGLDAYKMGLSNEIGVRGATRLLKNIMGLWLVQECRRSLARAGREYDYATLTMLAAGAPPDGPVVDATHHRFLAPADMPTELRAACIETGQTPPSGDAELIRCCLDSLALAYRRTLHAIEGVVGTKFEVLHIVGGGTKNLLLNQLAADACGIPVVAGPGEATAVGNVLTQMVGSGAVASWEEARQVCRNSFDPETFLPNAATRSEWLAREESFARATAN
ncbi:MAG TPA: rhamnulokinase family protein [Capsulimonadaceae bacterium]|jgi:rhamnulokinase